MIELIKEIKKLLETKHPRVYFERLNDTAQLPYVVFDLPSSFSASPREDFTLVVDVWDDNQDTTALETLVTAIDGDGNILNPSGLNFKTIHTDNITVSFYRETRGTVPDEDKRIRRRQLRYTCKTYL